MKRPTDINGNEIIMGPWYWAKRRTGKIKGTGRFISQIGSDTILFWLGDTGYSPDVFIFAPTERPPEQIFGNAK